MDRRETLDALPFARRAEQAQSPTLPLPPPRDAATTDAFLSWVANMPRERTLEVREAISAMTDKSAVAEVLNEQLFNLPCADVGRHLLLLSTIGELREAASIAALERFTWLRDERIFDTPSPAQAACTFSSSGMLQARAAEMMVWVLGVKEDDSVLRVIRDHPSRLVRIAAIDAYLFQRGDAPAAKEFLRGQISADDWSMIGLPRFGADTDRETFERQTAEYEAAHPSHVPRPQKRGARTWNDASVWLVIGVASLIGLGVLLASKPRRTATIKRRTPHVR
jgi:hypothetical protein